MATAVAQTVTQIALPVIEELAKRYGPAVAAEAEKLIIKYGPKLSDAASHTILKYGPKMVEKAQHLIETYGSTVFEQLASIMSASLNKDTLRSSLSPAEYEKLQNEKVVNLPVVYQELGQAAASQVLAKILERPAATFKNVDSSSVPLMTRLVSDALKFTVAHPEPSIQPAHGDPPATAFHECLFDLLDSESVEKTLAARCKRRADDEPCEAAKRMRQTAVHLEPRIHQLCFQVRRAILHCAFIKSYLEHNPRGAHVDLLAASEWDRAGDVIHLLFFFKTLVKKIINDAKPGAWRCELCEGPTEARVNQIFLELWDERDELINMLNVYFECSRATAKEFIQLIKPPCFPYKGTFPWDMSTYVAELFRRENNFRDYWPVTYHGVLYRSSDDDALAGFADQIIVNALSPSNPVMRHAFLYAVGDIFKPKHWCGIFIDLSARLAIFYNSLAKPEQENWRLVEVFNDMCRARGLLPLTIERRVTNRIQLQKDSNLCGHFVYDFFREMLKQPSAQLAEMFLDYAQPPQPGQFLDQALRDKVSNDFRFSNERISSFLNKFRKRGENKI